VGKTGGLPHIVNQALEAPRPGAGRRLLFLGDSFLAGSGTSSFDRRFPLVLGQQLGRGASVAILASGGWGTDQQLLAFEQKGRDWKPDTVILAFCANNDISNILSNSHGPDKTKPYFVLDEKDELRLHTSFGEPADFASFQTQRPERFRSYLVDLLRFQLRSQAAGAAVDSGMDRVDPRYRKFMSGRERYREVHRLQRRLSWSPQDGVNRVSAYIHEDFETNAYQWKLFDAILMRLKASTDAIGARLVVMLLPVTFRSQDLRFVVGATFEFRFTTPRGHFTFRVAEPRDRLRAITSRREIDLFDPTAEFIELLRQHGSAEEVWPNSRDRHFSELGHAILADQLRAFLEQPVENRR
jgi:hypothetical protein